MTGLARHGGWLAIVGRVAIVALCGTALTQPRPANARTDTYPRNAAIDVSEYVFRVAVSDESDTIEALVTVDARIGGGERALVLDLIGRETAGGTGMTVTGAWVASGLAEEGAMAPDASGDALGRPAPYHHADGRLRIELPDVAAHGSMPRGARLLVSVAYSGTPASGLRIGPNKHGDRTFFSDNWPSRARHWLATIDHISDKARSQMVVTAPARYQVISNGLLVEETDLGDGRRRTHWKQSVPIAPWLYNLGAARFAVQHLEPYRGIPIQTWVYAQDRDAGFYDFAYPTREALAFYSEAIGPYAYEKLANVQAASVGGGMEAATSIFYGEGSVSGTRSSRWRNVIVHEIAHQWWGNAVTEADWDDVWLSEGFATYFTLLFIEHAYGRDEFVAGLQRARDSVFAFYEDRPDYRIVHADLDDMARVTTGMQYQKGAWVLHMLRGVVGTETFWKGIRRYYARHFNGHATTDDFRAVMEEVHGEPLDWFFEQWLMRGPGGLELAPIDVDATPLAGTTTLRLRQAGAIEAPLRMPVELELRFADGTARRVVVELRDETATLEIDAPAAIVRVTIDPDTWLLWRPARSDDSGADAAAPGRAASVGTSDPTGRE